MHLWALRRLASRPLAWASAAVLLCAVPLFRLARPLGIATSQPHSSAFLYDLAFIGAGLGTLLALGTHDVGAPLLARQPTHRRLANEFLLLGLPPALLVALVLVAARIGWPPGGEQSAPDAWDPSRFAGLTLGIVHWAALALLLTRLPLAAPQKGLLLLAIAWVLPAALAAGRLDVPSRLRTWLDPSVHVDIGWASAPGLAPILALLTASALLPSVRSGTPGS